DVLVRDDTVDLAMIISDPVYKDIVPLTALTTRHFTGTVVQGKPGEDPIYAWIRAPKDSGIIRSRNNRNLFLGLAISLVFVVLLVFIIVIKGSDALPTANVKLQGKGLHAGDQVTAELDTARSVARRSTRKVRLAIASNDPNQVLCVERTKVRMKVDANGAQSGPHDLHNGDTVSVVLDAGQTRATLNLAVVSSGFGCVMDLGLDDVTSTD
ncbi:MAG: hypothetical protein ACRD1T_23550, partial [Acidimicrobiia bacterium]